VISPAEVATSQEPLSDEEVVARVLAGETEMFEIVMLRHNQHLYRVPRAILRNDGEAEDAMQDAYVGSQYFNVNLSLQKAHRIDGAHELGVPG
jgi:hypothetical protein